MIEDIIGERKKKLENLRKAGINPYPANVKRTHEIHDLVAKFNALLRAKKKVSVAGRIAGYRDQGGVIFFDLKDESGKIQAVANKKTFKNFDILKSSIDLGDFAYATGVLFKTKKGQQSIDVKDAGIITKSLRPMPADWYGLEEIETRLRQRYLDLNLNPEIKDLFRKKSLFWQETRNFLLKEDFLEVETPVLEAIPGGAEAEPFKTHHNALDTDFYLRISPELNLKRLVVGGYEKIFEIGRIFRNEGIDAEHLQDYTQMEMYWAYQDYEGLMRFVESLVKTVIKKTFKTSVISYKDHKVDWSKKWKRYDYCSLFRKEAGIDVLVATKEELLEKANSLGIDQANSGLGRGRLIDLIYKKTVRPKLIDPGFLINPPVDIEPLAKRMSSDGGRVERFQIVAYGTELGKGFSELNDPIDQRMRFEEQASLREAGDKEAQMFDEDYVEALEYGMPPTAGFAYSERLFAVLVNKPVRETVFFPLMKPKKNK